MSTKYMTLLDAAAYLGVKERFMRRLVFQRRIRFYKNGRFDHFDRVDLDAIANAGRVDPIGGLTVTHG